MMQLLDEVSQESGISPNLKAHAKIDFPVSCLKPGPGWEVLTSAVMLQGPPPVGRPAGAFPYQHGNVEFGCSSKMRGSSIPHSLQVAYMCLSFDTKQSGTAEGRCQPQDTSLLWTELFLLANFVVVVV